MESADAVVAEAVTRFAYHFLADSTIRQGAIPTE